MKWTSDDFDSLVASLAGGGCLGASLAGAWGAFFCALLGVAVACKVVQDRSRRPT